jgi:hypothetical protein
MGLRDEKNLMVEEEIRKRTGREQEKENRRG